MHVLRVYDKHLPITKNWSGLFYSVLNAPVAAERAVCVGHTEDTLWLANIEEIKPQAGAKQRLSKEVEWHQSLEKIIKI